MQTRVKIAADSMGITSLDKLGKLLCDRFPDMEWPKPRSLGVKLGELNNGKMGWWIKRPEFVSKLSEVLECAPQDLGIHIGAGRHDWYEFEDFPELQPLDLKRESPCELGYFIDKDGQHLDRFDPWHGRNSTGWLGSIEEEKVSWLYFPKGTGRDLFWAKLKARSPHECIEIETASSQVERLKQPEPIYLNVNDSAGERDLLALESKNKESTVLICAPFKLKNEKSKQTSREKVISIYRGDSVVMYEWRLYTDWHLRLLNWIEKRLVSHPDTLFDAKGLSVWLSQFSDQSIFDTPRNLVEICRFAHHYGQKKLPRADDPKAGSKLLSLLDTERPEYREDFRQLVHKWLVSIDLPWNGCIDGTRWREISESEGIGGSEKVRLRERIADEPDVEKRRKLLLKFEERIETKTLANLVDTRFLSQSETGDVSLVPRFLVDLLAREHLYSLILEKDYSKWAALCFEPSRSELVQQALELLTIEDLANCASRIFDTPQEDVFSIGATEAIFCAVGRSRSSLEQASPFLRDIAEVVIKRMLTSNTWTPNTWSSAGANENLWLAICWRWSLISSRPSLTLPTGLGWPGYFPGWASTTTEMTWHFLPYLDQKMKIQQLSTSERCLLQSAKDIAQFIPRPEVIVPPDVLIPFLLSRGIKQGWQIPESWWSLVLKSEWAQDLLVREIDDSQDSTTAWLISLIDCAISDESTAKKLQWFLLFSSPLRQCLLENADPKQVIAHLDEPGLVLCEKLFNTLPLTFQSELLSRYREHENALKWWNSFLPYLNDTLISDVIPWLYNKGYEGNSAAIWLWGRAPEKAQEVLMSEDNPFVKHRLVENYRGEIKYLPSIVKTIRMNSSLLSREELQTLVMRYLPTSAGLAPELIDLLNKKS